jgi:hypothetical protein
VSAALVQELRRLATAAADVLQGCRHLDGDVDGDACGPCVAAALRLLHRAARGAEDGTPTPARWIAGRLTQRAQGAWPAALVVVRESTGGAGDLRETWVLERAGEESVGLGTDEHEAQAALLALMRHERRRA